MRLSLYFFAIICLFSRLAADHAYRAGVRHIESGGIGYEKGYTTLELFFATDPSQWTVTPLLDVRGHVFDNGKWAANAGIGMRTLWKNRAYGINAYYDYRNTGRLNANQIGVGLETLGELFDFRINGYLPVGGKRSHPYDTSFGTFSGHYLILSQKIQSAMKGADAEFGFHFGKTESFDFYAAAGPYYFIGEAAPTTWGGKARIGGIFKDILALEISDSYDRTFHNKFQGQISLSFALGPKSKGSPCKRADRLSERMVQPVGRQEIIVIDNAKQDTVAIDPATGLPYFFVFVDNTSSSNGTYESPYHTLAQAQANSGPNDVIYVFPGNGTTTGMNSGITLQENQKFWGSGVSHLLLTTAGTISIPPQSSSSPTITNTNVDHPTGDAITLAADNAISGFTITSALRDAIYGANSQSLDVSFCTFENTVTFPIEITFPAHASVSITNNQFSSNANGIFLTFSGTSTVDCSNNTFQNQTSTSECPIEISSTSNVLTANIENNIFSHNRTGGIKFNFTNVIDADVNVLNNTMTNNEAGAFTGLGSSIVVLLAPGSITPNCSIVLSGNTFTNNLESAFYMHTDGQFTTLHVTASANTMSMSGVGKSGLVFATPVDSLTLIATNNTITNSTDNGIAIIDTTHPSTTGNITINNNTITDVGNNSNGIAINQDFTTLTLTMEDNVINRCQGTGILSYAPTRIATFVVDISGNTISNCENGSSNAASGLDIEQFGSLTGSLINNTLSGNVAPGVLIGSADSTVCLTMTGNSSNTGYTFTSLGAKLTPCNAVNTGTITGATFIQSCPSGAACP